MQVYIAGASKIKKKMKPPLFNKRFFAFLDILGFKELVNNNDHKDLVAIYQNLVSFPVKFYSEYWESEKLALKEKFGSKYENTGLRLINVSDSILMWTNSNSENAFVELLYAVKELMVVSISVGIPLRGSITLGDVEILEQSNNMSIIGKGLVRAYEAERGQSWSGCVIEETIFRYLRSYNKIILGKPNDKLVTDKSDDLVVNYDVPYGNSTKPKFVVNWVRDSNLTEDIVSDSFSKFNKRHKESEKEKIKTVSKILNTCEFFKKNI
jgi:hypothetical protein